MLLWAALILGLVLGVGVIATAAKDPLQDTSAAAMSDDDAVAQVVSAARQIVSAAGLQQPAGGYSFQSCATADEPPYQATVYATFAVPQGDPARYVKAAADAMAADGWTRSPVAGERFGQKLSRDGVTALINRDDSGAGVATLRLYGECRNWESHRDDDPVWTEVDL